MLNSKGFDLWADGYDKNVNLSEEANEYPFAGYKDVLSGIYKTVHAKKFANILDIGFGTGVLTKRLYDDGYEIYGIDFSERMIAIAKEKMPNAILLQHDFVNGVPREFSNTQFDYIISTYAFHHLTDMSKVSLITQLSNHLSEYGLILIGDVIFETRNQLNSCKRRNGDGWDSDEIYIVFNELKEYFPEEKIAFSQVSHCAGIITIKK